MSARLLQIVQTACAVLIIAFMVWIAFYDVQELPWQRAKDRQPQQLEFAPKPSSSEPPVN